MAVEAPTADEITVRTVRPAPKQRPGLKPPRTQPPYAVILEDDDHHTFDYVIEMLQKICGKPLAEAEALTREVNDTGRALVWSGSKEVAELKCELIRGFGPDPYSSKKVDFPMGCYIEALPG
jgi:ATP-dependent Clp protease adaptor protein ClpS